jgi:hypothetical protein
MRNNSFSASLFKLVLLSSIARLLLSVILPLGNDEVYYFTYSLQPDWNHFDHPPLVGIFIRFFTLNQHWINELSMRLTSILSAAICTLLIATCGRLIGNERTGLIAALLYTASIYTSIISGLFILPDSPQLVFWILSLYIMLQLIRETNHPSSGKLLLLGLLTGLACMSKIHGLFLWFSFGCYILFYDRKWLRNPYLYLSAFITVCIISPVIWWNINNDFITWRFHSERVEIKDSGIDIFSFLTTLAGQIFYNNPVNVFLAVLSILALSRKPGFIQQKDARLLCWSSLPLIMLTTGISLFRQTLPHWSGPGFVALILLSAAFLEKQLSENESNKYRRLLRSAMGFIIVLSFAGTLAILYFPGTISNRDQPKTGKGDITLDMYGWKEFGHEFAKIRDTDIREGKMAADAPLLVHKWFPGGHLLFYVTYPLGMRIIGEGTLKDLHKFVWLNEQQGYLQKGGDAYYISPSNYYKDPDEIYKGKFESITLTATIPQKRGGKIARYWYIYHLKNATQTIGARLNNKD